MNNKVKNRNSFINEKKEYYKKQIERIDNIQNNIYLKALKKYLVDSKWKMYGISSILNDGIDFNLEILKIIPDRINIYIDNYDELKCTISSNRVVIHFDSRDLMLIQLPKFIEEFKIIVDNLFILELYKDLQKRKKEFDNYCKIFNMTEDQVKNLYLLK